MTADAGARRAISPFEVAALAALTLLAACLRLWRLDTLPPGLHVDEAFNILDARGILSGHLPVFLPANAGRDVLFSYLQAPLIGLFGETAGAARVAAALAGTAAVPAVWLMARRLALAPGPGIALLAAAFTATSFWPLFFSRVGIRAIVFVPLVALAAAAWATVVRAPPERSVRGATLSLGVLLGAAAYAHPAGRALALLPGAQALLLFMRGARRPARAWAAAAALGLVLALPLAGFWARHPEMFLGHAEEVSVLGAGPAAVAHNAARVAGMFNVAGDPAPWRNLVPGASGPSGMGAGEDARSVAAHRGRPVFDLVTGLLFLIGLAWTVGRAWRRDDGALLALLWLGGLLLPSVLADAAPNTSRAIGAVPFVMLLAAAGLALAVRPLPARAGALAAAAWVAVAACLSGYDYFVAWERAAATPLAFDADKVQLGQAVGAAGAAGESVFVSSTLARHPTVQVAAGKPVDVRGYDPGRGDLFGPAGATETRLGLDPAAPADGVVRTSFVSPADSALVPDAHLIPGVAVGPLTLVAWSAPERVAPGAVFTPTLLWRVTGTPPPRLNTFLHLRDRSGATVAQHDGPPLAGGLDSDQWRVGERIVTRHPLRAPAAPGARALVVGWYDWHTQERLHAAAGSAGLADDGSAVTLGTVNVEALSP